MDLTRREFLIMQGVAVASLALPARIFGGTAGIPVLLYHDISNDFRDGYTISPSRFGAQMEWLYAQGYKTLHFGEAAVFFERGGGKAVVLTFDDGYASFMDYAFPLFREYGFKATINIIGRYVGSYIRMGGNRPVLSWDEYRHLVKSGVAELGCHMHSLHVREGVVSFSEREIEEDLSLFRKVFEGEMGKSADVLAWPFGSYDKKSMAVAKKKGFKYFLTSREGFLEKGGDFSEIPRLNVNDRFDLISFQQYIGEKI